MGYQGLPPGVMPEPSALPGRCSPLMRRPNFLPGTSLHRPRLDVLTLLSLLLVAVHAVVAWQGGARVLVEKGFYDVVGLSKPGLLAGKVWHLLTYSLFHGYWMHLLLNLAVIYAVGGRVMRILGGRAFARIYLAGVLAGALLHVLLFPAYPLGEGHTPAQMPLVGASGGMMALLLALTSLSPDSRMWPLMVSGKNLGRGLMLSTLILFLLSPGLGIPVLGALGGLLRDEAGMGALFQVSHMCHFGGGLVGMIFARRLLCSPVSLEDLRRDRERREGLAPLPRNSPND